MFLIVNLVQEITTVIIVKTVSTLVMVDVRNQKNVEFLTVKIVMMDSQIIV